MTIDDQQRGHQLGEQAWHPGLFEARHRGSYLYADNEALDHVLIRIGMRAATLDPPVAEIDRFVRGVRAGLREAHRTVIASHMERSQCDPSAAWGMCEYCEAYAHSLAVSKADRRRWAEEITDPTKEFAVLAPGSKVHTRGCAAVARMVNEADRQLERLTPADARHGGVTVNWPRLLDKTSAIAACRRRCRVCAPDLPDRPARGSVKGPDGRFRRRDPESTS